MPGPSQAIATGVVPLRIAVCPLLLKHSSTAAGCGVELSFEAGSTCQLLDCPGAAGDSVAGTCREHCKSARYLWDSYDKQVLGSCWLLSPILARTAKVFRLCTYPAAFELATVEDTGGLV